MMNKANYHCIVKVIFMTEDELHEKIIQSSTTLITVNEYVAFNLTVTFSIKLQ